MCPPRSAATPAADAAGREADDPQTEDAAATSADATDTGGTDADGPADGDGIGRRRLIRWIAVLAFGVPVAVESFTFGSILWERFVTDGTDGPDAAEGAGVGDELLPETAATETVLASELRGDGDDRTYVLRVGVENGTDVPVELWVGTLTLTDGTTAAGRSATGPVSPGERGEVTAAWAVGDGRPASVAVTALRDGAVARETTVSLAPPADG